LERRVRGSSQSSTGLRVLRRERKVSTFLYDRVSPRQTCHMLMVLMTRGDLLRMALYSR
jgi:hypothetical protein